MNILISTVGEEEKPIYEGIKNIANFNLMIYLASSETIEKAKEYQSKFKDLYESEIVLINPKNMDSIIDELIKLHNKYKKDEIFYNITCGTKIMSLSCFIMAIFNDSKIFYFFLNEKKEMEIIKIPSLKLKIDDVFKKNSRQRQIIELLAKTPKTMTELSKMLNLKLQTISGYIKKINDCHDFIEKEKINNRQSILKISENGKLLIKIIKLHEGNNQNE